MKKRLRKKLHKSEFTEYAFNIKAKFIFLGDTCEARRDSSTLFLDRLVDYVESIEMVCGGTLNSETGILNMDFNLYPQTKYRKTTYIHQDIIKDWLEKQPEWIETTYLSDLYDQWNGPFPDE